MDKIRLSHILIFYNGEIMIGNAIRNISKMFTKQGLLSLLLVLNIIVSALVICFSYGLYQNYNVILESGKSDTAERMYIEIKPQFLSTNPYEHLTSEVTLEMATEFIYSLSEETSNSISGIVFDVAYENEIYHASEKETGYFTQLFNVVRRDGNIVESDMKKYFDNEHYVNGDKVAIVGKELFEGSNQSDCYTYSFSSMSATGGQGYMLTADSFLPKGTDSILINNEEYEIIETIELDSYLYVPLTSLPLSSKLSTHYIEIYFGEAIDSSIYNDICDCAISSMGQYILIQPLQFTDANEIYYYRTIILISVVIAILAAVNMAILYRYILEKRSKELSIFRICGMSKGKAILSYLLECMILNAPIFALTQLLYHKLVMPKLSGLFPHMKGAYSFKLYAVIFGIYVLASFVVMLIMIVSTLRKHNLTEQKNSTKSSSKFGIMKIFEIIQLTIVLSIAVCIVSAIISRYQYYTPFEKYLNQKGYLVLSDSYLLYENEFYDHVSPAESIVNVTAGVQNGDVYLSGVAYSDEFIDAYAPLMDEGVWLSNVTETYDSTGYVPAVITFCDGKYSIGDIIENEVIMGYDEDGNPTKVINARYKIVGITKDNVYIPSKFLNEKSGTNIRFNNHLDFYELYDNDFDSSTYIFVKKSDEKALYGAYSLVYGTQLLFCDDMSDAEYKEFGEKLENMRDIYATPLSEIKKNSLDYIYEQMYTLFPIALCIFILTVISTVSISAIYTKRQLRNYAIFYICGAKWRSCALKSLKNSLVTCGVSCVLSAVLLYVGKLTFLKETVITFGIWHLAICLGVIILYLALSMIMPLAIIGKTQPREILKEE